MKQIEFAKKCNAGKLHSELMAAGFDIFGVSTVGDTTIIHLKDTEIKDPSLIVAKHIYETPALPKPVDFEKLKKVLKTKTIITDFSEIE